MNIVLKYRLWILIIVLLLIIGFVVFNNIDYEKYYMNSGIIVDYNKMKVYCDKDGLKNIVNNKKIIIGGKNFAYKNLSINNIIFDNNYYFEVTFDVDLNNENNIQNNLLDFKISLGKMTIFKYILSKIGGV